VSYVENFGLPLGATALGRYAEALVSLRPGDHLLVVSDGIVEAMNMDGEMWGFDRLEAAFRASGAGGPVSTIETILAQVAAFTDPAPPHDDMTVVALQVR
jgi:phosphoserine phosphatase RsbU/P